MGLDEGGRHRHRIVEVRQGASRAFLADWQIAVAAVAAFDPRVEHVLGEFDDLGELGFRHLRRPGEVVVNDLVGIAVIAFQSAADIFQPCHVHGGGEHAKVIERGSGDDVDKIAGDDMGANEADWNIGPVLAGDAGNEQVAR